MRVPDLPMGAPGTSVESALPMVKERPGRPECRGHLGRPEYSGRPGCLGRPECLRGALKRLSVPAYQRGVWDVRGSVLTNGGVAFINVSMHTHVNQWGCHVNQCLRGVRGVRGC